MTRYPAEHKARTRARLIELARGTFRRRGPEGVSIDKLMSQAGLTRGGFYAHFKSKEALFQEVIALSSGLVNRLADLAVGERGPALAILAEYLDPGARDSRQQCPMVAHAMDVHRGPASRRHAYADHLQALRAELGRIFALEPTGDRVSQALILAVGGATLGVAVDSEELAQGLESAALRGLRRLLLDAD